MLGYASSGFYLGSRVSQIVRNWRRHSAEGLSLAMFGCAIAANVTYGSGILLRTYTWAELRASTPWILGSLGTVSLDVLIFCQVSLQALRSTWPAGCELCKITTLLCDWAKHIVLLLLLYPASFEADRSLMVSVWLKEPSCVVPCRQSTTGGKRQRRGAC